MISSTWHAVCEHEAAQRQKAQAGDVHKLTEPAGRLREAHNVCAVVVRQDPKFQPHADLQMMTSGSVEGQLSTSAQAAHLPRSMGSWQCRISCAC